VEDCGWLVQYLDCSMEHYPGYSVALDSAFVVVFAEPAEADPESVGPVEAGFGIVNFCFFRKEKYKNIYHNVILDNCFYA